MKLGNIQAAQLNKVSTVISSREKQHGLTTHVSQVLALQTGISIAVLGKIGLDESDKLKVVFKDIMIIAEDLNSIKVQIQEDSLISAILLACSATAFILGVISIKEPLLIKSRKLFKSLSNLASRLTNQGAMRPADWQVFEEEQLCVVCYQNTREILFNPCRHFLVCQHCFEHMNRNTCMVCRAKVLSLETIIQVPDRPDVDDRVAVIV